MALSQCVLIILLIGVVEALFSCEHVLEMVYYEEVMHYDDLTTETLAQWSLPGILEAVWSAWGG